MLLHYTIILGVIGSILAVVGYLPYIKDTLEGKTKPHLYTRLIRLILTAITAVIQFNDGAGPGAWVTGFTAMTCLYITYLALKNGQKNITRSDTIAMVLAIFSIVLWILLDDPLLAMIVITIVEGLGFYPTFRKSYLLPYQETISTYMIAAGRSVLAIFALTNTTLVTIMYPLFLVIICSGLSLFLFIRRKQVDVIE